MPKDSFSSSADSLIAPARVAYSITPQDGVELSTSAKALYVGTGGDITFRAVGSETDVVLRNVVSGTILPIRIAAIQATGTTAADMVGLT
uniref:spike base protein, RCAP_Rcc01079 family n=1 Tax=uncultured Erythrobacter sp. TaxID=263913 RepID=UPI00261DE6AC|nr:hypothetical protein [uncultured Erythrobacter sp.]